MVRCARLSVMARMRSIEGKDNSDAVNAGFLVACVQKLKRYNNNNHQRSIRVGWGAGVAMEDEKMGTHSVFLTRAYPWLQRVKSQRRDIPPPIRLPTLTDKTRTSVG